MLQATRGIVLKTLPYGDTSLIVTLYTLEYGLQKYLQKGARKVSKKGSSQQVFFQPGALLSLVVYHREGANFQLIREVHWHRVYQNIFTQVSRYAVVSFALELLWLTQKQPEPNPELYAFMEDQLLLLDEAPSEVVGLFPAWYVLQLSAQLGFAYGPEVAETDDIMQPEHQKHLLQLSEMPTAVTLYRIKLERSLRRDLLQTAIGFFYQNHPDAPALKTLPVLEALLQ